MYRDNELAGKLKGLKEEFTMAQQMIQSLKKKRDEALLNLSKLKNNIDLGKNRVDVLRIENETLQLEFKKKEKMLLSEQRCLLEKKKGENKTVKQTITAREQFNRQAREKKQRYEEMEQGKKQIENNRDLVTKAMRELTKTNYNLFLEQVKNNYLEEWEIEEKIEWIKNYHKFVKILTEGII